MTALSPAQPQTHQDGNPQSSRPPGIDDPASSGAVRAMLEARTVALVGASPRPASFGLRMLEEIGKSPARPRI